MIESLLHIPRSTIYNPISVTDHDFDSNSESTPLVFLDVETTGASAAHGERVTELAIARVENGIVTQTFCQLFEVDKRIPPWIVSLTGISNEMLEGQPKFLDSLDDIRAICDGAAIVGHNVMFDLSFLAAELRRAQSSLMDLIKSNHVLDTVRLARKLVQPKGNSLQKLAMKFDCVPSIAHRAMADVETTFAVYKKILEPHGGHLQCVDDVVRLQGGKIRFNRERIGEATMPILLTEALQSGSDLRIEYLDSKDKPTERIVRPLHLIRNHTGATLIAFCHLRNDRRTFKLNRITTIAPHRADIHIDLEIKFEEQLPFDVHPPIEVHIDLIANDSDSVKVVD